MRNQVAILNRTRNSEQILEADWCESFWCRLAGLTFRRSLPGGQGLLLVESQDSRLNASIHMWFVFMDLGVAWLDSGLKVVDTVLARPWRMYVPASPARYILEAGPDLLEYLAVGDELILEATSP